MVKKRVSLLFVTRSARESNTGGSLLGRLTSISNLSTSISEGLSVLDGNDLSEILGVLLHQPASAWSNGQFPAWQGDARRSDGKRELT